MFALDRLTIRRFRGLRDLSLDDLGRVNLLVGPNDSGKTSILEAISVFCRPLDLRGWLQVALLREVPGPGEPIFTSLEWMFPHRQRTRGPFVEGKVDLSGAGRFLVREARTLYKPASRLRTRTTPSPGNGTEQNGYDEAGAHMEFSVTAEPSPDGVSRQFYHSYDLWEGESPTLVEQDSLVTLPVHMLPPHRAERVLLTEFSDVAESGLKQQTLSLVKAIDRGIRDVQILAPTGKRPAIYIDYASSGSLPLSAFGDGIRRAISIALLLPAVAGGVLLIDEIESSLHVTALGSLFSWLVKSCEELDVQLFATTHSLEAVDAMIEAESNDLDRIVGYHLEAPNGVPQVQRLDGHLLHRLRYERGLDVRL